MKERLDTLPVSQHYTETETNLALRNLLTATDEKLRNLWQDKEFLFAFPRMAFYLISSKGRMEFSKDQRAQIFSDNLRTFLSNNNQKVAAYMFTKNGEIVTKNAQGLHIIESISESKPISNHNSSNTITPETDEKTDSFTRTVTASILIIGMSLLDREKLISLVSQSHENLSTNKKSDLIDNLGRLLQTNCPTRAYIKDNNLDIGNGFDWDEELAYILFFGVYKNAQAARGQNPSMPQEMKDTMLPYYSLETLNVMLDYALDQTEHLQGLRNSDELSGFIEHMKIRLTSPEGDLPRPEMIKDMQKKLGAFIEAVSYKKSEWPIAPDSSLVGETAYVRLGAKNRPN